MFNPVAPDADAAPRRARFGELGLRCVCLFPAMHTCRLDDRAVERVFAAARRHGAAVFVHCGVLSVGVRKKLGLPSRFDLRLGDPLAVARRGARVIPQVPVIIPHFGAGLFREALMAADAAPEHLPRHVQLEQLDQVSPGPHARRDVFARALDCRRARRVCCSAPTRRFSRAAGRSRHLRRAARDRSTRSGVDADAQAQIFGGNFVATVPRRRTR